MAEAVPPTEVQVFKYPGQWREFLTQMSTPVICDMGTPVDRNGVSQAENGKDCRILLMSGSEKDDVIDVESRG